MPIVGLKGLAEAFPRPFAPKPMARPFAPSIRRPPPQRAPVRPPPKRPAAAQAQKTVSKVKGAIVRKAIGQVLKARPATPVSAPTALTASTEAVLQSFIAINEVLLDLAVDSSDAAAKDPKYQESYKIACVAEYPEKKGEYHQRAGARASELGSLERAEKHQRLADAYASLGAGR